MADEIARARAGQRDRVQEPQPVSAPSHQPGPESASSNDQGLWPGHAQPAAVPPVVGSPATSPPTGTPAGYAPAAGDPQPAGGPQVPAWRENAPQWGATAELQVLPHSAPRVSAVEAASPSVDPTTPGTLAGEPPHPALGSTDPMPEEPGKRGHGRAATTVAVTAAVVVAAAAAATGVGAMVLSGEGGSTAITPSAAELTVTGPPPGDVRLRDELSTITLTWADPSGGKVPFTVVGGRVGQPMRAMATVDPGRTSYTVNGLNPRLDYCFTVLAAWPTGTFATSAQVCTGRAGGAPTT